ncbi:hypothetical protein VNO77_34084 [Canavalia gladiata]|uniref:Uncharacterized protein n=1 Tax=Canavalia gladiata TaxID=3824 RepID=A0AAN9KFJ4_CANGL
MTFALPLATSVPAIPIASPMLASLRAEAPSPVTDITPSNVQSQSVAFSKKYSQLIMAYGLTQSLVFLNKAISLNSKVQSEFVKGSLRGRSPTVLNRVNMILGTRSGRATGWSLFRRMENPSYYFAIAFNPTCSGPVITVGMDEGQYRFPFDSEESPSITGQRINERNTNLLAISAGSEDPDPYEFELQLEEILSHMQLDSRKKSQKFPKNSVNLRIETEEHLQKYCGFLPVLLHELNLVLQ